MDTEVRRSALLLLVLGICIRALVAMNGLHGLDIRYHVWGATIVIRGGILYRDFLRINNTCYAYPPLYAHTQALSILLLGAHRPSSLWIRCLAYKLFPLISDALVGLLIYVMLSRLSRSHWIPLIAMLLYEFYPLAIVSSSWYGLFEGLPNLFLLLSLIALMTGREVTSAILMGLAVSYKIYPAVAALACAVWLARLRGLRRALTYLLIVATVFLLTNAPYMILCPCEWWSCVVLFQARRPITSSLSLYFLLGISSRTVQLIAQMALFLPCLLYILLMIYRARSFESLLTLTTATLALLVLFHKFIYPHYMLWYLPLLFVVLFSCVKKQASLWAEIKALLLRVAHDARLLLLTIYIASAPLIGLLYWRFYTNWIIVRFLAAAHLILLLGVVFSLISIGSQKLWQSRI